MRYKRVCWESFGYTLPAEVVTSDQLEARLAPAYDRLRLPPGRLELMTGIESRRFYPVGTLPGEVSIESARRALEAAEIDPSDVGALVHGSVCRDCLEPATACRVHHALGLPPECMALDVSNACLGILSGVLQVANMIELGQIRAGVVVGAECGRSLVDNTVERINRDPTVTRRRIKRLVASLTIGSGSVAVVLCHRELSRTGNLLAGATCRCNTSGHDLCCSEGHDLFMNTDSESLMIEGVATGAETFERFLREMQWSRGEITKTVCHQVGAAHHRLLFESLRLDQRIDFPTYASLGNTGAAALPLTMALGVEARRISDGDRVALLGIGSGINCLMLGVDWRAARVAGNAHEVGYELPHAEVGAWER